MMYHQPPPTTIFNPVILPPKAAKPIREIPQLPPASNLIKAIAKKLPGASLQLQTNRNGRTAYAGMWRADGGLQAGSADRQPDTRDDGGAGDGGGGGRGPTPGKLKSS